MTKLDFDDLRICLPKLQCQPERDTRSELIPQARAYVHHYCLDMNERFVGTRHFMGKASLAGFDIAVQYWLPPNPQGTLTVVHGYFDHAGLYGHVIRFALARGLAVIAYDQPGHGLSSGERLAINSFDCYGDVLEQLLQLSAQHFVGPRFLVGQSMGGATVLNHRWRYGGELAGTTALCAPLLLPVGWGVSRVLYRLLHRWINRVPRKLLDSSHDADFNRFLAKEDGLQDHHVSVAWVGAMKRWDETFRQLRPRDDRLLVVQGTGDGTVNWRYNLKELGRKLPNLKVELIEGAYHHLVNESDDYREPVFDAIERFFFEEK